MAGRGRIGPHVRPPCSGQRRKHTVRNGDWCKGIASHSGGGRRPLDALVRSAVDEIVDSGGNVSVAGLARRLGISERHFQRRFRRAVGITPKQFSRVRRFRACVVNMITEEPEAWGRVAVRSGYADQAHLIREFVRLSGRPPTALDAYIRSIDHGDVDP